MGDATKILIEALLQYGAVGILALAGWLVSGYLFWTINKRKEKESDKDKRIIETKDELTKTVKELKDDHLEDMREMVADYNKLASNIIHALDKLTTTLEVKNKYTGGVGGEH